MTDTTPELPPLDKPTTLDVAAILRARTKDLDGVEVGDFNDFTRPTGPEVERIIDLAYEEVTGRAGVYLGARCASLAYMLVIIRAAMWVEGSYWPEQVRSDRSIFAALSDQYETGVVTLDDCVAGNLPGGGGGGEPVALGYGMLNVHGATSVSAPYGDAPSDTYNTVPASAPVTAPLADPLPEEPLEPLVPLADPLPGEPPLG